MCHATLDSHSRLGNIAELVGVILSGIDSLGQVFSNLIAVNIKRSSELNIVYVILA